jgi:hypothetical protein
MSMTDYRKRASHFLDAQSTAVATAQCTRALASPHLIGERASIRRKRAAVLGGKSGCRAAAGRATSGHAATAAALGRIRLCRLLQEISETADMVTAKNGRVDDMFRQKAGGGCPRIRCGIQTENPGEQQIFRWAREVRAHGEGFLDQRFRVVQRLRLMIHRGYLWQGLTAARSKLFW